MIATDMLEKQHREVSGLFKEFEKAKTADARRKIFEQIADALAIHASIEEKHFYPAVKKKATEDMLLEAVEEHLGIKRVIADLLKTDASDDSFKAKAKVLKEDVEHHVEEEEKELFPKVKKLFDDDTLEAIAAAMQETADELASAGDPRLEVPNETEEPAPL